MDSYNNTDIYKSLNSFYTSLFQQNPKSNIAIKWLEKYNKEFIETYKKKQKRDKKIIKLEKDIKRIKI